MERRDFMTLGAVAVAGSVLNAGESTQNNLKPTHPEAYELKPLNFDPKSLKGFSEKIIMSHYNNNYGGAVKRGKTIEEKIAQLQSNVNPFELGALKREQMVAINSMILHEYYFDNLGASGKVSDTLTKALTASFGSIEKWEDEFRKTALSLGGGSGWGFLVYNDRLKRVENVWAWDHMHGLWDSKILLALDMYEHSYQMDFGANTKEYLNAFFANINWDVVNKRFEK